MDSPRQFTTDLVHQAGQRLLSFYSPEGVQSSLKLDNTVVTEADLAADALITAAIRQAYPNDAILTEESLDAYAPAGSGVWIIDPLDGTTNFSLGLPIWGISIARLVHGQPDTAAVYFPILDELYTAQRGQGAQLNGAPIRTNEPKTGHPAAYFTCCSRTHRRYQVDVPYKTRIWGAATYNLICVARGSAALAFESSPKIWDIAAAWLIGQEAGAHCSVLHGPAPFPWSSNDTPIDQSYPALIAASADIAALGRERIQLRDLA